MLTDVQLDERLNDSPAPRVTERYIKSRIESTEYHKVGGKTLMCKITLDNGFVVTGVTGVVSAANYDQEIGEKVSYDKAFARLWPLFGFLMTEQNYIENTSN